MNFIKGTWICVAVISAFALPSLARQTPGDAYQGARNSSPSPKDSPQEARESYSGPRLKYVLGVGDEFTIFSDAEEISGKTIRIAPDGDIHLPEVGDVHVDGMTVEDLQSNLIEHMKRIYKNPHVALSVTQYKSQPVSVYGAVASNGEIQLEGRKTLTQVIAKAGGPRNDAGYRVIIKRPMEHGPIPLPSNMPDPSGKFFIAEARLRDLLYLTQPENDIEMIASDTITIPPGEVIYVTGAVNKPGGFVMEYPTMPVRRLVTLAGGAKTTAKLKSAVILREETGGKLQEIPIDLSGVNGHKADSKFVDIEMQPRDILVIDDSAVKGEFHRTAQSILQTITGMAIYRIP